MCQKVVAKSVRMSLSAVAAALLRESYRPSTSATEGTSSHKNGHISTTAELPSKIVADSVEWFFQMFSCGRMVPELFWAVTKKKQNDGFQTFVPTSSPTYRSKRDHHAFCSAGRSSGEHQHSVGSTSNASCRPDTSQGEKVVSYTDHNSSRYG